LSQTRNFDARTPSRRFRDSARTTASQWETRVFRKYLEFAAMLSTGNRKRCRLRLFASAIARREKPRNRSNRAAARLNRGSSTPAARCDRPDLGHFPVLCCSSRMPSLPTTSIICQRGNFVVVERDTWQRLLKRGNWCCLGIARGPLESYAFAVGCCGADDAPPRPLRILFSEPIPLHT